MFLYALHMKLLSFTVVLNDETAERTGASAEFVLTAELCYPEFWWNGKADWERVQFGHVIVI